MKNFIERHLDGYVGIDPTSVGLAIEGKYLFYEFFFTKNNLSETRVLADVDTLSSVVTISSE